MSLKRSPSILLSALKRRGGALKILCIALALSLAAGVGGCTAGRLQRSLKPPEQAKTVDQRSPYLKVHMKDGELYVLSNWRIDESARQVVGEGERLGLERKTLERDTFTIPLDAVALFETNVVHHSPAVAALAVITGISVAVTVYCIGCNSHTDTAGSLPTAYRHDIVESRNLRLVGMCEQGPGSLEAIALHESSEG